MSKPPKRAQPQHSSPQGAAPAPVPAPAPAPGGAPLSDDLRDVMKKCADAADAQLGTMVAGAPGYGAVVSKRDEFRDAQHALENAAITAMLSTNQNAVDSLNAAATAAENAAAKIQDIANAVGLVASLLALAAAIGTAVSTGNPMPVIPSAQAVIRAVQQF